MKKETILKSVMLALMAILYYECILAQNPISRSCNAMRQGDLLYRIKVDYVEEGETGENITWTLGSVKRNDIGFLQSIVSNGDTIAIFEKGCIKHYLMHGDTIYYKGHQQRHLFCLLDKERPIIRYPFVYGDSISGDYEGRGKDDNLGLSIKGWGYTVADGIGMLADGKDTIAHVIRLRLFDDYIEDYGGQVTIQNRCYRYLWYSDGYRYPVMESLRKVIVENGEKEVPMDSVTFLYLPDQQNTLGHDDVNDSILNRLITENSYKRKHNSISCIPSIKTTLSADGMHLIVDYSLSSATDITIRACDIFGYTIGLFHNENKVAGNWQEQIILNRKPIGKVLMLNIQCGGESMSIKLNNQ